jgi:superfamily II RNA helicase
MNNKSLPLELRNLSKNMNGNMVIISDNNNRFNSKLYDKWMSNLNRVKSGISKNTIINDCINYLWNADLCPVIFFTFSRTRCEILAKSVHQNLLDKNDMADVIKITDYYIGKSHNREIYSNLQQWIDLKKCLYKGVAFHHSGLIPLFKEIIELLYGKNLIKCLFATETFAVGVNMPTRSVVFTSLEKMVDGNVRYLFTSEYLQMAGRAGRRGIDTLGTVIILPYGNNDMNIPSENIMRELICGKPQTLTSKFSPDYQFILRMILLDMDMDILVEKSLYHKELIREQTEYKMELTKIDKNTNIDISKYDIFIEYDKCNNVENEYGIKLSMNVIKNYKKRQDEIRNMDNFNENYKKYREWKVIYEKYNILNDKLMCSLNYTRNQINKVLGLLYRKNYLIKDELPICKDDVTKKGLIACGIQECNGILMAELIESGLLDNLDYMELASVLSLFSDTKPIDKHLEDLDDDNIPDVLYKIIDFIRNIANEWETDQIMNKLSINMDWQINMYIVGAVYRWMNGDNIKNIIDYYNVFEGNFIKDMLKIYNIAGDLIDMAKIMEKNRLSIEASKVVKNILRDIVNVETIYVKI